MTEVHTPHSIVGRNEDFKIAFVGNQGETFGRISDRELIEIVNRVFGPLPQSRPKPTLIKLPEEFREDSH